MNENTIQNRKCNCNYIQSMKLYTELLLDTIYNTLKSLYNLLALKFCNARCISAENFAMQLVRCISAEKLLKSYLNRVHRTFK